MADAGRFPHLSKAPITEALIDIQVSLPQGVTTDVLMALHHRFSNGYPAVRQRHRWEGKVELKTDARPEVLATEPALEGFLFGSGDRKQVAQYRLNGFTLSRLEPYEDWRALRTEAQRLWTIYREGTRPQTIDRLAVRYINLLQVAPGQALEEVLRTPPRCPPGFPGGMTGFLQRQVLEDQKLGAVAVVTQAMEAGPAGTSSSLWIDIDVFQIIGKVIPEEELWSRLEAMATSKNEIFFSLITVEHVEALR